jgi:hypothetical protein
MKSFIEALDGWSREGFNSNFIFADTIVQLEFGEEFSSAVCRVVKKFNIEKVELEIKYAIEWWISNYSDMERISERGAYKFLELLMLIAIKGHSIRNALHFDELFSSMTFQQLPQILKTNLISQCVTMVGEWCLPEGSNTVNWSNQEKKAVNKILQWLRLKEQDIDEQDALVCLASMARIEVGINPDEPLGLFLQYFIDIFHALPKMKDITKEPEEFMALQTIFESIKNTQKYSLIKLFSYPYPRDKPECQDVLEYLELFGLSNNDYDILSTIITDQPRDVIISDSQPIEWVKALTHRDIIRKRPDCHELSTGSSVA